MKKIFLGALLLAGGVYNFVIANSDKASEDINVDRVVVHGQEIEESWTFNPNSTNKLKRNKTFIINH